jgi:hypothetical protein
MKAVTRHLAYSTPAEDIYGELISFGFDVISDKLINRRSSVEGTTSVFYFIYLFI